MINALTGCCVFCGSPQIISAKDDLSQRDADRRAEYDRRLESKRLNWDCDTYTPTHERARVRLQHARGKHK